MDRKTFTLLACGLAVTVGLALAIHWRVAESPIHVLVAGLCLIAGGAVCVLSSLGLIVFQRKRGFGWDSCDSSGDGGLDFDGGGDGGD